MSGLLEFKSVTKSYNSVVALDDISFKIEKNEICGLIGSNGAGKSTTLKLIIKYLSPDSGCIFFKGQRLQSILDTSFPVSYIPDEPIYFEELSVKEHLSFVSSMYSTQNKVNYLINIMELEKHLDKVPSNLSKGSKQKLSICCALLRNYELLIADEPFTGLDPKQIKVFKDVLQEERNNGKTIILSTHLLNMIENICDVFIMLKDGNIVSQGALDKIIKENETCSTLEELYLLLAASDQEEKNFW